MHVGRKAPGIPKRMERPEPIASGRRWVLAMFLSAVESSTSTSGSLAPAVIISNSVLYIVGEVLRGNVTRAGKRAHEERATGSILLYTYVVDGDRVVCAATNPLMPSRRSEMAPDSDL